MKDSYTHITLIVDHSGSMGSNEAFRLEAESGINKFIKEQKEYPGEATLYFSEFNTIHSDVFGPGPIGGMGEYKLIAEGFTALNDAYGRGIARTGEYLKNMDEADRPAKVVLVCVTDGGENSSQEYKLDQVQAMAEEQRTKYGWEIVFLAANIDAQKTGTSMGSTNNSQYAATAKGMGSTYSVLSTNTSAYRGAAAGQSMASMPDINAEGKVWDDDKKEWVDPPVVTNS